MKLKRKVYFQCVEGRCSGNGKPPLVTKVNGEVPTCPSCGRVFGPGDRHAYHEWDTVDMGPLCHLLAAKLNRKRRGSQWVAEALYGPHHWVVMDSAQRERRLRCIIHVKHDKGRITFSGSWPTTVRGYVYYPHKDGEYDKVKATVSPSRDVGDILRGIDKRFVRRYLHLFRDQLRKTIASDNHELQRREAEQAVAAAFLDDRWNPGKYDERRRNQYIYPQLGTEIGRVEVMGVSTQDQEPDVIFHRLRMSVTEALDFARWLRERKEK